MEGCGTREIGGIGLKVTGALAGTVFVDSLEATVGTLRAEIARLMSGGDAAVKMIVGGRNLQDDSRKLCECGVTATSRVLVARGSAADAGAAASNAAAERARRLERVRQAADALAGRDSRGLSDDYALDIEDQGGSAVAVKPEDRRNLVFGLVLHDKAKDTMKKGDYASALDELLLAEEALCLCDPALTSAVDNVALLLLDLVWAAYKLGDLRRLAVSRERLSKARAGLVRSHGAGLERLRNLTGSSFSPELATYLRLEVLEGLVAYYGGEARATAEGCFRAAQAKWRRLQVSDEALALLQGMGYGLKESRRGLRFSGGDVSAAVDFVQEHRSKEQERSARRKKVHDWNYERINYGKTAGGQYVDPEQLDKLAGLGFERALAAEALRKNENRGQEALDELSKPERRRALQLEVMLKEGLKASTSTGGSNAGSADAGAAGGAGDAGESNGGGGGGGGAAAVAAVPNGGVNAAALEALKSVAEAMAAAGAEARKTKEQAAAAAGGGAGGAAAGGGGAAGGGSAADGEAAAAAAAMAVDDAEEAEAAVNEEKERVKEAEKELVRHVQSDPMAAYDIDVSEEGDIIATFLTLLSTGAAASGASG